MQKQKTKSPKKYSEALEMAEAAKALRKQIKNVLKKKNPSITESELHSFIDEYVPLFIKALYKADTRAFTKLMDTAFGKPK